MVLSNNLSPNTMVDRWQSIPFNQVAELVSGIGSNDDRLCMFNFGDVTPANRDTIKKAESIRLYFGVGNYVRDSSNPRQFNLVEGVIPDPEETQELLALILEILVDGSTTPFVAFNESISIHTRTSDPNPREHLGVSSGYKRAAFANWTAFNPQGIPDLFYISAPGPGASPDDGVQAPDLALNNAFSSPRKINYFEFPTGDRQALINRVDDLEDLWCIMGVTYGHFVVNTFNINPIFGGQMLENTPSANTQSANTTSEDTPSENGSNRVDLLLDVLIPCPPHCSDD